MKEVKKDSTDNDDKKEELVDKTYQIMKLMEQLGKMNSTINNEQEPKPKEHKFWTTQPVSTTTDIVIKKGQQLADGPIESRKSIEEIRKDPYLLPAEFCWCNLDLNKEEEKEELYLLLNQNYVEDVESLFRFDYPAQFLEWSLKAPGWEASWHVGIRVVESRKLVAFISAIPILLNVKGTKVSSVEVNFLCVHKKLRSKRLAPVMIREITRRVNLKDIFQALYTAGAVLPGLLSKARYYHRPINFEKLVKVGFTSVPLGKTITEMNSKYQLAKKHNFTGSTFRPMQAKDTFAVYGLLSKFLESFTLSPMLSEEDVKHWLLPREKILFSYVVERADGTITDFVSFYSLPSTVVNNNNDQKHDRINVAYLFYYAASSSSHLIKLIEAVLIEAHLEGFDVFNCVQIMKNGEFLKKLQFGEGDGCLNYYLYNWRTNPLDSSEIAVVML